jgi:AcrR family transcriptional regulator
MHRVPRNRHPDQKTVIREKATKLFAKNGYHATGIEDISKAVGLGRGALYHHIGSKEQLLFEISNLGLDELMDASERIVHEDMSAAEKLNAMSRVLLRNLEDNLDALTVYFREVDLMSSRYRKAVVTRRHQYEELWTAVIDQGVASGEFRDVDRVIIKGMLGMHNYAYLWIRRDGRLTPEQLADLFCSVLLDGLRGQSPRG